ncbi:hypothetical protein C8Q79DRAFT_212925 [Trametes meyenii]|nr:hypothetical protein C8Q79DRAFT_212925 [Trametes meyenii]
MSIARPMSDRHDRDKTRAKGSRPDAGWRVAGRAVHMPNAGLAPHSAQLRATPVLLAPLLPSSLARDPSISWLYISRTPPRTDGRNFHPSLPSRPSTNCICCSQPGALLRPGLLLHWYVTAPFSVLLFVSRVLRESRSLSGRVGEPGCNIEYTVGMEGENMTPGEGQAMMIVCRCTGSLRAAPCAARALWDIFTKKRHRKWRRKTPPAMSYTLHNSFAFLPSEQLNHVPLRAGLSRSNLKEETAQSGGSGSDPRQI